MFRPDNSYTKNDIYRILSVPKSRQKGAWNTGYTFYDGDFFIFANINTTGRTGHDYNNYWDEDIFVWEAKNKSHLGQDSIQKIINPPAGQRNFLFTREDNRSPFIFEGTVEVARYEDTSPVKIWWKFAKINHFKPHEEPIKTVPEFVEGGSFSVTVTKYERNPAARRACLKYWGYNCQVCSFNFFEVYGELGKNFIHVHHRDPISAIKNEYKLDAIKDLVPVCPNCHAMLHKKKETIPVEELKSILEATNP